jgi:hypothetical protein
MALYKHQQYLQQSTHEAFDSLHSLGAATPFSGIYKCANCGDEIASNKGNPLPPQNHKQHDPNKGKVLWRLIVFAETK